MNWKNENSWVEESRTITIGETNYPLNPKTWLPLITNISYTVRSAKIESSEDIFKYLHWANEIEKLLNNTKAEKVNIMGYLEVLNKWKERLFRKHLWFAHYVIMSKLWLENIHWVEVKSDWKITGLNKKDTENEEVLLDFKNIDFSEIKDLFDKFEGSWDLAPKAKIIEQHTIEDILELLWEAKNKLNKEIHPNTLNPELILFIQDIKHISQQIFWDAWFILSHMKNKKMITQSDKKKKE